MLGREATLEHFDEVLSAIETFKSATRSHEHDWHWKKLRAYAEGLFQRAPFKPGDRVQLTKTPRIDEKHAWGWLGAKHFMVKGARATVKYVDYSDGHFEAWVHFDDDSWLSFDGTKNVRKPEERYLYHLWETSIEKVTPSPSPDEPK